jgi:enoyl-CoA hydratase/carnithine racemase
MTLPDESVLTEAGLLVAIDGAVATVTLNKPERRNCQDPQMWYALAAIGAGLPADIRIVVIKGEGPTFSAGLDLSLIGQDAGPGSVASLMSASDTEIIDTIGGYQEGFTWLADPNILTIAQVQGAAVGAGFQLALACDLRVVADNAKFSMKEPALGLVPDLTGTKPLVDIVGYSRALEICATARFVEAGEAHDLGIATYVVPLDELDATTKGLADAVLANNAGAVRGTKALLREAPRRDLDAQRLAERTAQVERFRELAMLFGGNN